MSALNAIILALFVPRVEYVPDPRTLMLARWTWRKRKQLHAEQLKARMLGYEKGWARRWAGRGEVVRFEEYRPS